MANETGKITKENDDYKVKFERHYPYDIETVWDAITNREKLKHWFTDFEMELQAGSKMKIIFRDKDKTVSYGEIIEVDPPNRFVWTWEGELAVWELFAEGANACRLIFTYSRFGDSHVYHAPTGFHVLLDRLEELLGGIEKYYPFGTEQNEPSLEGIKQQYKKIVEREFPGLLKE